jgi:hypothetical protein
MLEAAIQKGDLGEGGYEAWILLGETRNMDEREDLGLRALFQGVKGAEIAGALGPGILVGYFLPMPARYYAHCFISLWPHLTRMKGMTEPHTSCCCAGSRPNFRLIPFPQKWRHISAEMLYGMLTHNLLICSLI